MIDKVVVAAHQNYSWRNAGAWFEKCTEVPLEQPESSRPSEAARDGTEERLRMQVQCVRHCICFEVPSLHCRDGFHSCAANPKGGNRATLNGGTC